MTTVGDLFPSRFLKAEADFDEGESKTLTIARWEQEELGKGQQKEPKPVIYFNEIEKGLVLNKTNAAIIASNLDSPTLEEWVGKQVVLFTMEVDSFGDIVRAIRVKPKAKGKVTQSPKAGTNGGNAKPPFKDAPQDNPFSAEALNIASLIRGAAAKIVNGDTAAEKMELQRLAAVVNKVFETLPEPERNAIRHAVYSFVVQREVTSGKDLTHGLIEAMLQRWELAENPFYPNETAKDEANKLATAYQIVRGQQTMALPV